MNVWQWVMAFYVCILALPAPANAWENYSGRNLTVFVREIQPGNIVVVNENRHASRGDFAIRFYGVGIPTLKQPFGMPAQEQLRKLLPKGTKIIITTINEDANGIVSALVQLEDHSINNRLIAEGLAWVDRSTCKAFFCRRWHIQEHLAIKEKRGIWSLNIPTPPWQWGEVK